MTDKRVLEALQMQPLSEEEKTARHILGRLYGPIATCKESTRNGRLYNKQLWETALQDDLLKEKIATKGLFLELGHPADREETDMTKVCACIPELPKIVDDDLYAYVDILDTPNGKLLKTLVDYGFIPGISSRGSGDVMANNEVDPETFFLETWDIVQLPAVKKARLAVCESIDNKNIKLRKALTESIKKAPDEDKKIMAEALDNLKLNVEPEAPVDDKDIPLATEDAEDDKVLTECAGDSCIYSGDPIDCVKYRGFPISSYNTCDWYRDECPEDKRDTCKVVYVIMDPERTTEPFAQFATDNCFSLDEATGKLDSYLNGLREEFINEADAANTGEAVKNLEQAKQAIVDCLTTGRHAKDGLEAEFWDTHSPDECYVMLKQKEATQVKANEGKEVKNYWREKNNQNCGDIDFFAKEFDDLLTKKSIPHAIWIDGQNRIVLSGESNKALHESDDDNEDDKIEDTVAFDDEGKVVEPEATEEETTEEEAETTENADESSEDVPEDEGPSETTVGSLIDGLKDLAKDTVIEITIDGNEDGELVVSVAADDGEHNYSGFTTTFSKEEVESEINKVAEEEPAEDENPEEVEEPVEDEADDAGADDEVLESLKEKIRENGELDKKVKDLQSAQAVSDAKVKELTESLAKYKAAFERTSKLASQSSKLQKEVKQLKEQLETQKTANATSLKESTNATNAKVNELTEALKAVNAESDSIKEELAATRKKLTERTTIAKKYQNKYFESVNRYIDSKAQMLGVNAADIKSKLKEGFTMDDIDAVCNELLNNSVSISRLPFGTGRVRIQESGTPAEKKNRQRDPDSGYEIDDDLLVLAGLK